MKAIGIFQLVEVKCAMPGSLVELQKGTQKGTGQSVGFLDSLLVSGVEDWNRGRS